MKRITALLITIFIFCSLPISNIYAEWNGIVLIDEISDNGNHFYWVDDFSLPYSESYISTEESILESYVLDFDGNSWDLYSYSIELIGDGLGTTYDSYVESIKSIGNGYHVIDNLGSDVMLNTIGDNEFMLHQDRTVIAYGDNISLKKVGDVQYSKGEANNYAFMIDYIQNRYNSEIDKKTAISLNDPDNEEIMRAGELSISILVPNGKDIKEYYFNGSSETDKTTQNVPSNDDKTVDDLLSSNLADSLGENFYVDNNSENIIIKNDNDEEVLVIKKDNNKFSILVKDENLLQDEDYLKDVITETIFNLFSVDDNTTINKTKYGYEIINKETGEVIQVNDSKGIANTTITINDNQNDIEVNSTDNTLTSICVTIVFIAIVCLGIRKIRK